MYVDDYCQPLLNLGSSCPTLCSAGLVPKAQTEQKAPTRKGCAPVCSETV